jgi:hypothetical protein
LAFRRLRPDDPVPTPAALTQILSCQSREQLETLADLLFLQGRPPTWMHASELPKSLDGMIGMYGFAVDGRVSAFGEPVDHVYFVKDWVVTVLPRLTAERIIRAQKIKRAPITVTEQYYGFVDPEVGPMAGAFAPTGDAVAKMLIEAFGDDAAPPPSKAPPPAASELMLVGCNYAVASQANFLIAARSAEELVRRAATDVRRRAEESEPRPAR